MMAEESFGNRVLRVYGRWTFVDIFIADGAMIGIVWLHLVGLLYLFPLILVPTAYMLKWGSPSRPIMHFIKTYMDVGEPPSADKEFIEKITTRFDWFGLFSPWKDFDAVFV